MTEVTSVFKALKSYKDDLSHQHPCKLTLSEQIADSIPYCRIAIPTHTDKDFFDVYEYSKSMQTGGIVMGTLGSFGFGASLGLAIPTGGASLIYTFTSACLSYVSVKTQDRFDPNLRPNGLFDLFIEEFPEHCKRAELWSKLSDHQIQPNGDLSAEQILTAADWIRFLITQYPHARFDKHSPEEIKLMNLLIDNKEIDPYKFLNAVSWVWSETYSDELSLPSEIEDYLIPIEEFVDSLNKNGLNNQIASAHKVIGTKLLNADQQDKALYVTQLVALIYQDLKTKYLNAGHQLESANSKYLFGSRVYLLLLRLKAFYLDKCSEQLENTADEAVEMINMLNNMTTSIDQPID